MPTRNPLVGLFQPESAGGWSNQDMMAIGDIIKSMMMKESKSPKRLYDYLYDAQLSPQQRARIEEKKKRDREQQLLQEEQARIEQEMAAVAPSGQAASAPYFEMQRSHAAPAPMPFEYAGPPQPAENERADLMWQQFQKMNPDLDYAAVARQSGGNVPGGTFSDNSQNKLPEAQSDQALFDFVNNQIPQYEAQRKLDPRSRGYDPAGAQVLLDMVSNNKRNSAYDLMQRAQMLKAESEMRTAQLYEQLVSQGMIPSGVKEPRQQVRAGVDEVKALDKLASDLFDMNQDVTAQEIMAIKGALAVGNVDVARKLLSKYVPMPGMDPSNAPIPPGVVDLGEDWAVGPDGTPVYTGG